MTDTQQGSTSDLAERLADKASGPLTTGRTLQDEIRDLKPQIADGLPGGTLTPDRFVRTMLTEVRKTPELLSCNRESFLGAMMTSAQLGLEVGNTLGQAYLIPYKKECTFQIGYKGWISLGARGGILLEAREVRDKDNFIFDFGTNPRLEHSWELGVERGDIIGYYGTADFADGRKRFHVMDLADIELRKKRSQVRSDRGPWKTDPVAMSKKTVIRAMAPQLPMTPEIGRALETDEGIVKMQGDRFQVSFPDALDLEVDQGTPVIEAAADSKRATLENMIEAIPHPKAKQAAIQHLMDAFAPIPNIPESELDEAIADLTEWLSEGEALEDSAPPPVDDSTTQTPSEAPEATQAPQTSDGGDPVANKITAFVNAMASPVVAEWASYFKVENSGKLEVRRLRILPLLVQAYKDGDPAVVDAF